MEKSTHSREYKVLRAELRATRENAGLTQRELAALLKVPHSWVAKVESGERRIDLIELGWLVSACGVDPSSACERVFRQVSAKGSKRRLKGGQLA